ncbi:MAG: PAS domain-containing protein [Bacillota bacterium]
MDGAEEKNEKPQPCFSGKLAKILAGSSPLGIYIIQDGRFQFLNPGFSGLTGYDPGEMLGKDCFSLVYPADKSRGEEKRRRNAPGKAFRWLTKIF